MGRKSRKRGNEIGKVWEKGRVKWKTGERGGGEGSHKANLERNVVMAGDMPEVSGVWKPQLIWSCAMVPEGRTEMDTANFSLLEISIYLYHPLFIVFLIIYLVSRTFQ